MDFYPHACVGVGGRKGRRIYADSLSQKYLCVRHSHIPQQPTPREEEMLGTSQR